MKGRRKAEPRHTPPKENLLTWVLLDPQGPLCPNNEKSYEGTNLSLRNLKKMMNLIKGAALAA